MTIAIITEAGVRKVAPLVVAAQEAAAAANMSAQVAVAIQDGHIYPDYATGNAATIAGQYFIVAANGSMSLHVHGTATALVKLPIVDVGSGNLLLPSSRIGLGTVTPAFPLHIKASSEIARFETTMARGSGDGFIGIADPSGRKGYIGYGGADDTFYLVNELNAPIYFGAYGSVRWFMDNARLAAVADNSYALGGGSNRCTVIYAATGTINTSDAREKTAKRGFSEGEMAAAKRIAAEIGIFEFLTGVRSHVGVIAQEVWAIMADEGLIDPIEEGVTPSSAYAFLCYDEWEADAERGIDAGNRFGIRPDQLALFLIAAQAARLAAIEAAISEGE